MRYPIAYEMSSSTSTSSLRDRVLRAGGWTIAGYFVALLIRVCSSLVMTRLLAPEMFGLMAIVYVVMTGLALFSDLGLGQIVVQSPRGQEPDFLNTVWAVQIVRGALMCLTGLLFSAALPFIAHSQSLAANSVYANPLLPLVIAIFMSSALIGGFESTKSALARRTLAMATPIKIGIVCQVFSVIVMITWAALEPSIWALVAGSIVGAFLQVVLSHILLPGPDNRWAWDASAFKEIVTFGKWIIPSSVFAFFIMNGDRLLLGGLVNAELLGLYSIAFLLSGALQSLIHYLMGIVAFPALSEVARDSPAQLKATYYKFRVPFDVAMLSVSGILFTFGSTLIRMLYDTRYSGAGPIVEILALGMISARYYLMISCYNALGKTKINTITTAIQTLVFYVFVPVAYWRYQFEGAVWAIALCPLLSLPVIFYFKRKYQLLDVRKELLVLPSFVVGAIAGEMLSLLVKYTIP